MIKMYRVNEIFYSIQGEGGQTGMAAVFLRLAGCNLGCNSRNQGFECDTDYVSKMEMTAEEIVQQVVTLGGKCKHVILTGGEPLLQLDVELVEALRGVGLRVSLETNGTVELPDKVESLLHYITVSPKRNTKVVVRFCDEVRYVLPEHFAPYPEIKNASFLYVSPVYHEVMGSPVLDKGSMRWCAEFVKNHPKYRLSTQDHKYWGIR